MVASGSFRSSEYLSSSEPLLRLLKSLFVGMLFLTPAVFTPLSSTSGFCLSSIALQTGAPPPDHKTDEAKAILYFFTAHWCEPCREVQPFVERLCKKHSKVVDLAFIDFDSDRELVESFQVKRIPAFVLLDSRRRFVFRAEDGRQETLEALARAVEKLDPTRKEVEEPEIPHSSPDPKQRTSHIWEFEKR